MLAKLKLLLGITDTSKDSLLELIILIATDLAKRTLYPYKNEIDDVELPAKYDYWVIRASQVMYQNLGNESVKSYSENGLSISYADMQGGISHDMLNELIPMGKAIG